jgi:hypothetical protein
VNRRILSLAFLALSLVFIIVDVLLPQTFFNGLGPYLGPVVEWGMFAISVIFLVLFVAFRGRSF